jgi:hypothetical protein
MPIVLTTYELVNIPDLVPDIETPMRTTPCMGHPDHDEVAVQADARVEPMMMRSPTFNGWCPICGLPSRRSEAFPMLSACCGAPLQASREERVHDAH